MNFDCALELSFHQCFVSQNYHFTYTPYPEFITSPVRHALALSIYQRPVFWRYHFTNAPYRGIITTPMFHAPV